MTKGRGTRTRIGLRRRALLACLALAGIGLVVGLFWESPRSLGVPPPTASASRGTQPTLERAAISRAALEGNPVPEPPLPPEIPSVRFVDEAGVPVPGVVGEYVASGWDSKPVPFETDARGSFVYETAIRGRYCTIAASHPDHANWNGSCWAEGATTVRLTGGCRVSLEFDEDWRGYAGQEVQFRHERDVHKVRVQGPRVLLGRFRGGVLKLSSVGDVLPSTTVPSRYAVPRSGELTLRFLARSSAEGLRLAFLTAPWTPDRVNLTVLNGQSAMLAQPLRTQPEGADRILVVSTRPPEGRLLYLASAGGEFAAGGVVLQDPAGPETVRLEWLPGAHIRVQTPERPREASMFLLSMDEPLEVRAAHRLAVVDPLSGTDRLHLELSRAMPRLAWPTTAHFDGNAVEWYGLPPHATLAARIVGESGDLYEATLTTGEPGSTASTTLGPNLAVEITATDESGELFQEPLEVYIENVEDAQGRRTVMRGGRLRVCSTLLGTTCRVILAGLGYRGEGQFRVGADDVLVIRNEVRRFQAKRVRATTHAGTPLAGATVHFSGSGSTTSYVRTDADGFAAAPIAGDWPMRARIVGPDSLRSDYVELAAEETVIVAQPRTPVVIHFQRALGATRVRLVAADRPTSPGFESVVAMFQGDVPANASITFHEVRAGRFNLEIRETQDGGRELVLLPLTVGPTPLSQEPLVIEIP